MQRLAHVAMIGRGEQIAERDGQALLHLLEVQQAELQVQNAELRAANEELRRSNDALSISCDRFRVLYEHAPTPYFTVDAAGTIIDVNRAGEAILATPRDHLLGGLLELFIEDASREAFRRCLAAVFAHGHDRCGEMPLRNAQSVPIDVLVDGVVLRDDPDESPHCVLAFVDITTRKRAEQALRRAQDEMLAIVSHDLRGPLHAIALANETIATGVSPAVQKRCVSTIERATDRCERLIEDLLGVAHLESGRIPLHLLWVDAGEIVEQVCFDHEPAVAAAGSRMTMSRVDGPHLVCGDRDRLHQALSNLIRNALAHARGAQIEVDVRRRGDRVVITVADDGPGIAVEDLPFVFERYRQGANSHGGAGLGLAIVKGVILAHRGTTTVSSKLGHGARFEISLPLIEQTRRR